MKKLMIAMLLVGVVGCHQGYIKQGATKDQYYDDMTACLKDVSDVTHGKGGTTHVSGGIFGGSAQTNPFESEFEINMRNACMERKGWRIGRDEPKFLPFN